MITLAYWVLTAWQRLIGHRWYFSTSCRHKRHKHCRCRTGVTGDPKTPGTCKWCPARCICPCHKEAPL